MKTTEEESAGSATKKKDEHLCDKLTKVIYESGALVGELFKYDTFVALVFKKGVCLRNVRYSVLYTLYSNYPPLIAGGKNYITLEEEHFGVVLKAAGDWNEVKDSLWGAGRRIGNCMGYAESFFPPNTKDNMVCCPDPTCLDNSKYFYRGPDGRWDKIFHKPGIEEFRRRVSGGGLDFTLERFCFVVQRAARIVSFDEWQVPFISQAFGLHKRRKGIFAPTSRDICRIVDEECNGISICDLSNWRY